jgi:hypothetical protein
MREIADRFDDRNPENDTFDLQESELFNSVVMMLEHGKIKHDIAQGQAFTHQLKAYHLENEEVYLLIDGNDSEGLTVQGFHNESFNFNFPGITKKNAYALDAETIKSFLTVLDFNIA